MTSRSFFIQRWEQMIPVTSNSLIEQLAGFGSGFASLKVQSMKGWKILKQERQVRVEDVYQSIKRQTLFFVVVLVVVVYVLSDNSIILRKCTLGWRSCMYGSFFTPPERVTLPTSDPTPSWKQADSSIIISSFGCVNLLLQYLESLQLQLTNTLC